MKVKLLRRLRRRILFRLEKTFISTPSREGWDYTYMIASKTGTAHSTTYDFYYFIVDACKMAKLSVCGSDLYERRRERRRQEYLKKFKQREHQIMVDKILKHDE